MSMGALKAEVLIMGGVAVALIFMAKRAAGAAGQAIGTGARAVDSAISNTVGAIGSTVGLPTPSQTIHDPAVVRYLIDTKGWFYASQWATASALVEAMNMPAGSGSGGGGVTSSVGTVTRDDTGGAWSFKDLSAGNYDPFDLRNYGQTGGSIYGRGVGIGEQYAPTFAGGLGSSVIW